MGTSCNQDSRENFLTQGSIVSKGKLIKAIAKELGISFNEALDLYMAEMKLNNYDVRDEQLASLGDLMKDLINAIKER